MTDKELMQQAYALPLHEQLASVPESARLVIDDLDGISTRFIPVGRMCHEAAAALRERLAQEPNMPEQYVMVGRFMLQPHPKNGYWLTDTGSSEGMQIFQPEMERVIKELWKQF